MKATERIKARKEQILYRKKGRKYVSATDPWAYNGLRNGWWLIKVQDNSTSIREQVFPDKTELDAAARDLEDRLVTIIREASRARPNKVPLNPDEKRDWEWFIKKHGESFSTLAYPSFQENAEKIVRVLLGKENQNE